MAGFISGMQRRNADDEPLIPLKERLTNEELINALEEVQREISEMDSAISDMKKLIAELQGRIEHRIDYLKYLECLRKLEAAREAMVGNSYLLIEALDERAGNPKSGPLGIRRQR